MGNQISSSPCFNDQAVQSTLSWAEKKQACTKLFNERQDDATDTKEGADYDIVADKPNSPMPHPAPNLPALTDNLSSSEQDEEVSSSDSEDDDSRVYQSYTSGSLDRDARIDLGTSRGSTGSGGREDHDAEDRGREKAPRREQNE